MEHAQGAVVREKGFWKVFDPHRDPRIDKPYAFDMAAPLVQGEETLKTLEDGLGEDSALVYDLRNALRELSSANRSNRTLAKSAKFVTPRP